MADDDSGGDSPSLDPGDLPPAEGSETMKGSDSPDNSRSEGDE